MAPSSKRSSLAIALHRASALVALLLAILCPPALAQAGPNLLQDGGFENLGSTPGTASTPASIGAWITIQGTTALLGTPYGSIPSYEGTAAMHVGNSFGPGYVEQTFPTSVGSSYTLSFAIVGWQGGAATVGATVSGSAGVDLSVSCASLSGNVWSTHTLSFVAGSASSVLRIQNTSGASTIDDVRCTPAVVMGGVPEIELAFTSTSVVSWTDGGSGGNLDGSFWWSTIPAANPQFRRLGTMARAGYSAPSGMVVAKDLSGSAFADPVSYVLAWTDAGSGANMNGCFWVPVPPPGYVVLGHSMRNCGWSNPPPLSEIVCVRADLCVPGTLGNLIYND